MESRLRMVKSRAFCERSTLANELTLRRRHCAVLSTEERASSASAYATAQRFGSHDDADFQDKPLSGRCSVERHLEESAK